MYVCRVSIILAVVWAGLFLYFFLLIYSIGMYTLSRVYILTNEELFKLYQLHM